MAELDRTVKTENKTDELPPIVETRVRQLMYSLFFREKLLEACSNPMTQMTQPKNYPLEVGNLLKGTARAIFAIYTDIIDLGYPNLAREVLEKVATRTIN